MARPVKIGLDYFPFDTGFFGDRKIRRLLKTFGGNGVEVYVFVLCEIYRDKGYYVQCDENFVFDIADGLSLKESFVREVIRHCVVNGLFDQRVYDVENSLTSHGVQKRYLEVKSRSSVAIDSRYFCKDCGVIDAETEVNDAETPINDATSTQRKEKKRKVKESKEKPARDFIQEDFIPVFDEWLEYKSQRKEAYKCEKSIRIAYENLFELSGGRAETAKLIVRQSIGSNWAGLFALKAAPAKQSSTLKTPQTWQEWK